MAYANHFSTTPARKPARQNFRAALRRFSDLVICPPAELPAGQLEAQRIDAAARTIAAALTMRAPDGYNRFAIGRDLAEMAKTAPADRKCSITAMLADRLMMDVAQSLGSKRVAV